MILMFRRPAIFFVAAAAFLLFAAQCSCTQMKFASSYMSEGLADYANGNYIEAILNLRSAELLSPNPVEVDKYLGEAYAKMSLWRQAAKEFGEILFLSPSDPDRAKLIDSIHLWEHSKDYVPAMAQYSFYSIKYKNRIFSDPENLLNYLALTEIYKCSGRYTEAENFFRALIRDRPDKIVFKKYLAEVLYFGGKYAEAGILYKKILEEEPLNTDALVGYNLILKQRYEDMLAKDPSNMANHLKLARVLKELKRYEDSISEFDKYLKSDSANADVIREKDETQKVLLALTRPTP